MICPVLLRFKRMVLFVKFSFYRVYRRRAITQWKGKAIEYGINLSIDW